jgi:acetyl esterase/lipase
MNKLIVTFAIFLLSPELLSAQVVRQRDIIYQRAEGVALTMDVFVPEKPNGIGIIKIVSGGWKSRYEKVTDGYSSPYTDHGYTVFAVFHGSQPRYKVRDIMGFMHRAVRFIRTNADRWSIDPNRIGVTGSSAEGHLSYHISEKTPPISIIHGDADPIVPLFQSQSFKKIAESKGVPIELVIKEGAKHGWPNKEADEVQFLNWFNRHLLK